MIKQIFITLLILSSMPAFGSGAAGAAADVKSQAAHQEADSKVVHYDGELDLTTPHYTYEPPSAEALKEAYEKASKQKNQLDILVELCKPYAKCNPDRFAYEVFLRWEGLCDELGLLITVDGKFSCADYLRANVQKYNALFNPIAGCCLGLVLADGGVSNLDEGHYITTTVRNFERQYFIWQGVSFHNFKKARQAFNERGGRYPEDVRRATSLPYPLPGIVGEYANECGLSLEETLQLETGKAGDYFKLDRRMLLSLEGLSQVHFGPLTKFDFDDNLISSLVSSDLPLNCTELSLSGNRLYELDPAVFAQQSKLKSLGLHHNFLCKISRASLEGLVSLTGLGLCYNNISVIEEGALTQLPNLQTIGLAGNSLQKIPADIEVLVKRGQLTGLRIDDNPFESDPAEQAKRAQLMAQIERNKDKSNKSCSVQ